MRALRPAQTLSDIYTIHPDAVLRLYAPEHVLEPHLHGRGGRGESMHASHAPINPNPYFSSAGPIIRCDGVELFCSFRIHNSRDSVFLLQSKMVENRGNGPHAADGVQTGVAPVPVTLRGPPENLDKKVREPHVRLPSP